MENQGKTMASAALITGASSGLGVEFARLFAQDGHPVVLVARRKDRLEALAAELQAKHGIIAYAVAEDLRDPEAPDRIERRLAELNVAVIYLVNNAGFGLNGPVASLDHKQQLALVQVNITALVSLTRLFLPAMVARGAGRILNVGSTAGFQPGPFMAAYYASKAFVNSFTEALSYELKGTGVTATVSCPGATQTEFSTVAGSHSSRLFRMSTSTAEDVAREAYQAMHAGRPMIVHGARNKFATASLRIAPRSVVRAVTASLNQSPDAKDEAHSGSSQS